MSEVASKNKNSRNRNDDDDDDAPEDEDDDDDDDDDDDEEFTPLHSVDWKGEGWYRPEQSFVNECDDRVRIEERSIN